MSKKSLASVPPHCSLSSWKRGGEISAFYEKHAQTWGVRTKIHMGGIFLYTIYYILLHHLLPHFFLQINASETKILKLNEAEQKRISD
jgi:hypothetical protein